MVLLVDGPTLAPCLRNRRQLLSPNERNLGIPSIDEPVYRAFRLDASGHVDRADEIQAVNDDEAKAAARELVDGQTIELWDRDRRVAVYPPLDEMQALHFSIAACRQSHKV